MIVPTIKILYFFSVFYKNNINPAKRKAIKNAVRIEPTAFVSDII